MIIHINGINREATKEEETEIEATRAAAQAEAEAQEQDDTTRAAARQAVLDKLGLTADEAAALFG